MWGTVKHFPGSWHGGSVPRLKIYDSETCPCLQRIKIHKHHFYTLRQRENSILSYFRFFNIVWLGVPHYQTIKFQAKRGQYRISRFLLSLIAIWNIHSSSGVTIKFSETAETWEQTYRGDQVGSTQQQQTHFNALLAKVTRFLHFYRQMHEIFSFSYFALKINEWFSS